jgi:ABC-type molybdate transport system substrate-binding protein
LDGLPRAEEAHRHSIAAYAARQYACADRSEGLNRLAHENFPLLQALGPDGKLAMASVDTVPAGKYGKAALTYFGVWDQVAPRVAQAENVRAALAFVARGEPPLGIRLWHRCEIGASSQSRRYVSRG